MDKTLAKLRHDVLYSNRVTLLGGLMFFFCRLLLLPHFFFNKLQGGEYNIREPQYLIGRKLLRVIHWFYQRVEDYD